MSKRKPLTRRQHAVIEALLAADCGEQDVLAKYHVTPRLYRQWLADERFRDAFEARIAQAYRAGRIVLARSAYLAAETLVALAQTEGGGETARKACLDIIASQSVPQPEIGRDRASASGTTCSLTPEAASRILALLAADEPGT